MSRRRSVPAVIELLETWLAEARTGELTAVALVGRYRDGEYGEQSATDDLPDMVLEMRSAVIRFQSVIAADDDTLH
jgi:hypothetical protein